MLSSKSHIDLESDDLIQSTSFYKALLGAPASRQDSYVAVFESDCPPLILTLQQRTPERRARRQAGREAGFHKNSAARWEEHADYALVVGEPREVGQTAIALRRAGAQLRLRDAGIEASDPDGTVWQVRFVPWATGRTIVKAGEERLP